MSKVLIIDDDQRDLENNRAALVSGGYSISSAGTADEARRMLLASRPDLVIVEPMVPGPYDGFALVRQIAADHPHLPIIVLTHADEHMSAAMRASQDRDGGWLPAQRYMEKPVSPEVVLDEVDHVLHEVHQERP